MDRSLQTLITGYLDEQLTAEQFAELESLLRDSAQNRQQFVTEVMLHDRLRATLMADELVSSILVSPTAEPPGTTRGSRWTRTSRWTGAALSLVVMGIAAFAILWNGFFETSAAAAATELNRLITANATETARTYHIAVEDVALKSRRKNRPIPEEQQHRPPKPPLNDAVLHVRGAEQFVLIHTLADGQKLLTGCDGRLSWSIRPDGPVRTSRDLTRFSHDLPGHEHSMTFLKIDETLQQLQRGYEIRVLPEGVVDDELADDEPDSTERLLIAMRRRKMPGPERVEIVYDVKTGEIRQIRFVAMPYGPDRLTIRMTLLQRSDFGVADFGHAQHHGADRIVIEE